jgi:YesN/AraC family two-component response regulator
MSSVLIVDDEAVLREQIKESLELYIDNVYEASNGVEAYEVYQSKKPTVILTDIEMPKLNGLGFVEKIREHDQQTKIIILSAYTNVEYFQKAVKLYLVSYLVKPVPSGKLKEAVLEALEGLKPSQMLDLNDGYSWDQKSKTLWHGSREIKLTTYEQLLLECLIKAQGQSVSYEEIHYYVYDVEEFSQNAIASLVKRVRKKSSKDLIASVYKKGYKI